MPRIIDKATRRGILARAIARTDAELPRKAAGPREAERRRREQQDQGELEGRRDGPWLGKACALDPMA